MIIRIYKPADCKSSNNYLFLEYIRHKLEKELDLTLNIKPNRITYGTKYLINFLILNEPDVLYQELNIDFETSKYLQNCLHYCIRKNTNFFCNLELFPIKITQSNPKKNSISFRYSQPNDCYLGYYITCSENNRLSLNATLNETTSRGECNNLTSGTKYIIKSTVYGLYNQTINENVSACTGKI